MRSKLILGGVAAALLAGVGCRSSGHVAGRCDCTNHPESAVIPPPAHNYPVIGGATGPATAAPGAMAGPGTTAMPGASVPSTGAGPMAMPAPERLPVR